jgi:hypothetical protein
MVPAIAGEPRIRQLRSLHSFADERDGWTLNDCPDVRPGMPVPTWCVTSVRRRSLHGEALLISYDNVAAISKAGCTFLAPASKTYVKAAELAACDLGQATEVGYAAQRDAHKDPGQLGRRHVLEDVQPFQIRNSRRKSDPPIRLRRVFVHSTARAHAAATSRAKKLARAEDDLNRLLSGLGGRFYPDEQKVTARLQQIARDRKAGPYLRYTAGTAPAGGGPGVTSASQASGQTASIPDATGPGPADTCHGTGSGGPGKPALMGVSGSLGPGGMPGAGDSSPVAAGG